MTTADEMTTGEPTTEYALTNETPDGSDNYIPVFDVNTRKWAYLASGVIGMVGGACSIVSAVQGVPAWVAVLGGVAAFCGSAIAGMFGVHYAGVSR